MKRATIILCLGLMVLALAAPVAWSGAAESSAWLGPYQVQSLYTQGGSGDLYVKINYRTLVIPMEDSQGQALARAAWQSGRDLWYQVSGETITAVWVGESPY